MTQISEFFAMGGYGAYVWSSYGIALVVLLATAVAPLRHHRQLIARIARRQRRAGREQ